MRDPRATTAAGGHSSTASRAGRRAARRAGTVPASNGQHGGADHGGESEQVRRRHVDAGQALAGQVAVHDGGHQPGQRQPEDRPDDAAQGPHHPGLDQERAQHVPVAGADGLQDADLPAALPHRGQQGVRDPERGNGEGDDADAGEHDLDHVDVPLHGGDEVLGSARRVPDRLDRGPDRRHRVEAPGDHEQARIRRAVGVGVDGGITRRRPPVVGLDEVRGRPGCRRTPPAG